MSISGTGRLMYADNITGHDGINDLILNDQPLSGEGNLSDDYLRSVHYVQAPPGTPDYGQMQLQISVRRLHLYYIPSVYSMTILGNAFGIAVLTDRALRLLPSSQYLIGILAVEVIHALTRFHQWVEDNGWETGVYNIGGWCQFATFTSHIMRFLRTWYTVMLAADCYVCHFVPACSRTVCREWVAQSLLTGAGIVAVVVYLNISMLYGTVMVGPRVVCTQLQMFSAVHEHLDYGDVFINAALPSVIITALMLAASRVCCSSRAMPPSSSAATATDRREPREENSLKADTKMRQRTNAGNERRPPHANLTFTLCFLALHLFFSLPVDIYRCVNVVRRVTRQASQVISLDGFLIEQILRFLRWTKCACNLFVLLAAYPLFRTGCYKLPSRIGHVLEACCKWCRPRRETQEILEV